MRPHSYSHLILTEITNKTKTNKQTNEQKIHTGEKIASSRNGGVQTGELQVGERN